MTVTTNAAQGVGLTIGSPTKLIEGGKYYTGAAAGASLGRAYDVSPDGQRFIMIKAQPVRTTNEVVVVVDWFEELKRLVATN